MFADFVQSATRYFDPRAKGNKWGEPYNYSSFLPGSAFQIKVEGGRSWAKCSALEADIIIEGSRKFAGQGSREKGAVQREAQKETWMSFQIFCLMLNCRCLWINAPTPADEEWLTVQSSEMV